jgi:hypothetical protein
MFWIGGRDTLPPPDMSICFPWKLNRAEFGASQASKLTEKITQFFGTFLHQSQ